MLILASHVINTHGIGPLISIQWVYGKRLRFGNFRSFALTMFGLETNF